ncbi:MAG: haloacid dehalogenase type II [Pseudomonadota bacterium]
MVQPIAGIKAAVFDAYGTLFDVMAPTTQAAARIGDKADALGRVWRDKQLQYTWLRSLQGAYIPFRQVTEDALDFALEALAIDDPALKADLLDLYVALDAYPDAHPCLEGLRAKSVATAILSNGSQDMLQAATRSSALAALLDHVLSVEEVGINKPDARVYQLACDRLECRPDEILFVSGNGWDGKAGAHFGYRSVWINRAGLPPERLPGNYVAEITSLEEIPGLVV